MDKYDYIIAGAGCAGLSLLSSLMKDAAFDQKNILVIDRNFEKSNDCTWCFWEKGNSKFDPIVSKQWDQIEIIKGAQTISSTIDPYAYKMIRGIDFYSTILSEAKKRLNISFQEAKISKIENNTETATVQWEGGQASANFVFSSIVDSSICSENQLKQHFKGRWVEFEESVFNAEKARLMDFNVNQLDATAFMYVLPITSNQALVEYTLFSTTILAEEQYDAAIDQYLQTYYSGKAYKIMSTEKGIIPMDAPKYSMQDTVIIKIGTAGNAVKPSTGYAFQFIQEQCKQIIDAIKNNKIIKTRIHSRKHHFYDKIMLAVLIDNKIPGDDLFLQLFAKNRATSVLQFLSNQSSLLEDFQIIRTLPTRPFLSAAIKILASSYNG